MQKSPVTEAIASYEYDVKTIRRKQAFLRTARAEINHRLAPLLKAFEAKWLRWEPSISVWGTGIEVNAYMHNVDGFSCKALADILEAYIDADEVKSEDHAANMTRMYKFKFLEKESHFQYRPEISVCLQVQVKSDSVTCQRVLKESKEVISKQDVYVLVCSDEAQAE
jgi:hypothetical protein